MSEVGIFDIIGPNMIGPSSSHTAGAVRIARLAGKIAGDNITDVKFTLYGSFSMTYRGHGTDRALVAGILGFATDDIRIRDSFSIASGQGINFKFIPDTETVCQHPNTVDIAITTKDGKVTNVTGVSIGGGAVVIKRLDGVKINFTGQYHTILIKQNDTPGIVAHITNVLSKHGINIAFMRLYRESKGDIAYSIIEADESIPKDAVDEINRKSNILSATLIAAS